MWFLFGSKWSSRPCQRSQECHPSFFDMVTGPCQSSWHSIFLKFSGKTRIIALTYLLTTSKAWTLTAVNHIVKFVTFTMDIKAQAKPLRKKVRENYLAIKKWCSHWRTNWKEGGGKEGSTGTNRGFGYSISTGPGNKTHIQDTQLRWVSWGCSGLSLPQTLYEESSSMNSLTWPTDCKENI